MNPVILFRQDKDTAKEAHIARRYFRVYTSRNAIPERSLVLGRYSTLPFYNELSTDLAYGGSRLINTDTQFRYISDMGNWYRDLQPFTPKTWTDLREVPDEEFPIVIKGETNSKKFLWDTHMFAENRQKAHQVVSNLCNDGLVGDQRLYFRKYERFMQLMPGFRGMPVTLEFRCFVLLGQVVSKAFYWSNYAQDVIDLVGHADIHPKHVPDPFLQNVIAHIGKNASFYAIDVALRQDGVWRVVEINDGQMSGLSCTDPALLYSGMRAVLDKKRVFDVNPVESCHQARQIIAARHVDYLDAVKKGCMQKGHNVEFLVDESQRKVLGYVCHTCRPEAVTYIDR